MPSTIDTPYKLRFTCHVRLTIKVCCIWEKPYEEKLIVGEQVGALWDFHGKSNPPTQNSSYCSSNYENLCCQSEILLRGKLHKVENYFPSCFHVGYEVYEVVCLYKEFESRVLFALSLHMQVHNNSDKNHTISETLYNIFIHVWQSIWRQI